jgi:hypothetical protein
MNVFHPYYFKNLILLTYFLNEIFLLLIKILEYTNLDSLKSF